MTEDHLPSTSSPTQRSLPPKHRRSHKKIPWRSTVGVVLLVLELVWTIQRVESVEQPGFAQDCSGFSQDLRLRDVWPGQPGAATRHLTLAAMAPRLAVSGTALATYDKQPMQQTMSTLESIFGMARDGHREVVETTFHQEGRAVMLYPNVLATVAHVLTPESVEVQRERQANVRTVPLTVTSIHVVAHLAPDANGVPARVAHLNMPYDLALIQTDEPSVTQPFPYAATLSYGTGDPSSPSGGLRAGDCVAALVPVRDEQGNDTGLDRLAVGKVLAKGPVATNNMTQTKLNVNMFTTDVAIRPGDSGSPVLALHEGKPVLVGLVASTMYPVALFTYVTRIDPLLALADALRTLKPRQPKQASDARAHLSEMTK